MKIILCNSHVLYCVLTSFNDVVIIPSKWMKETNCLDPSQSGFKSGHRPEPAAMMLGDNLQQDSHKDGFYAGPS